MLVICLLASSFTGCLDGDELEQTTTEDETDENNNAENTNNDVDIIGCMDESAQNYDENATITSDLCLTEEELLDAEEVFWSSWDGDVVNNATEPIGYLLMLKETSDDENESRSLDIQEVFSSDYYDQKILLRHGGAERPSFATERGCQDAASSLGLIDEINEDDRVEFDECHYSSQTVFDNLVQVEKYSGGKWDNYSMETAATYDDFRNRLEHGPGIRGDSGDKYESTKETETSARSENNSGDGKLDSRERIREKAFPSIDMTEFESIDFSEVELRGNGRTQTIYYFAKEAKLGTEIEVMGEMTEEGFKITEYCNEIPNTDVSIIDSHMGIPTDLADGDDDSSRSRGDNVHLYLRVSARIILLEVDGDEMRFEEYDYAAPIEYGLMHLKAIPFYFEGIPDNDTDESENKSATEGRKGLNAVNVKVVIAGPSGPYGIEGDLSDYRLVTSNCTLDNATTGVDESATSARSGSTRDAASGLPTGKRMYGSDGNTCTNIDLYDLSDSDELLEHGITFVDADSSGTLSEGDRFEFSETYTCDGCDEANMLRLYSISADEFSDGNINPSNEMSSMHQGAMNVIRNIRAVVPDDPPPPVRAVDHNTTRSNR